MASVATPGYSGTPLPQKLGLKDGQRVLFLAFFVLASLSSPSIAVDVRGASENEMIGHLKGCWIQEETFRQKRREERLDRSLYIPYTAQACFMPEGVVDVGWFGGDEGKHGQGKFELVGGKLRLQRLESGDAWIFGANDLECDVIMQPGRAMKLLNCVEMGDSDRGVPDSSYAFSNL